MSAILTGMKWNLSVVLICISFMAKGGEHFFMCFLAIWNSSFEKVMSSSVAHLFYWFINFGRVQFFELPVYSGYQSFV
jgi:hypothetical protein